MAFNVWIVIGNFLTSPHKHWLSTTTAACNGTASSSAAILNSTGLDDVTATTMTSSNDGTGSFGVFEPTTELPPSATPA